MSRRQYKKPPIEEALCELRFDETNAPGWDLKTPALLQDAFHDLYPGKYRLQNVAGVTVGSQAESSFTMSQTTNIQFPDHEGRRVVLVAPHLLSIHMLRPYSTWEDFQGRVNSAIQIYREICKPSKLTRLGVRYINRVPIPSFADDLQAFVSCAPSPLVLPRMAPLGVFQRTDHLYDDGVRLAVTFAKLAPQQEPPESRHDTTPEGHDLYLLDLDLIWEFTPPADLDAAPELINDLHTRECDAFEALITDRLRGVFDDVSQS